MTKVKDIIKRFEQFAPLTLAEPGDPSGFQLGSPEQDVKEMMTTLDVRPEVVKEAIENNVDFIFAHHPVMFRPAKNLNLNDPQNQMYADLLSHHIAVYAAHTSLDNANGGMNDWLAKKIGLTKFHGLVPFETDVPELKNKYSMGRVGELTNPLQVGELAILLKQIFGIQGLRMVTDNPNQMVSKVAILGGDGGKFYPYAIEQGAQVYITGDLYYHTSQDMLANGLSGIDPGHHMESICKPELKGLFEKWSEENQWGIHVMESTLNTDPFTFV